jgi:hypothetical protein
MNRHGTPISGAPNQASGSPGKASGLKGRPGLGRLVGAPTSVASPSTGRVFRLPFWLSSRARRELDRMRVVAPNKKTENNGLEQTGSAAANGVGGPCSSIQC